MIGMDIWTTIRVLKRKGMGTRRIARHLGISRNTVRRALRSARLPKYERPPRPNPQLEPLREDVLVMLNKRFIGSRILEELRKKGYKGSTSGFYLFLKKVKVSIGEDGINAVERFETPPGKQAQFDWSCYKVKIGGKEVNLNIFCFILGFSRKKHYTFSLDTTSDSVLESIEDSLWHFGGVPEEILTDNPKVFVVKPGYDKKWNERFLEFCGYYRINPITHRVRTPKTKGKVENPFYYFEQHFIKGKEFRDFEHFQQELSLFEKEVNGKVHSTTQERPDERFEKEKDVLGSLPDKRFVSIKEAYRKVSSDCLISYKGTRYSVPYTYTGKSVWVRTSKGMRVNIYSQKGEIIASHPISVKKGLTITDKRHYEGLRKQPPKTRVMVEKTFREIFPEEDVFIEEAKKALKRHFTHHIREIISLLNIYEKAQIKEAIKTSLKYKIFTNGFIKGILKETGKYREDEVKSLSVSIYATHIDVKRGLDFYQKIITGGDKYDR